MAIINWYESGAYSYKNLEIHYSTPDKEGIKMYQIKDKRTSKIYKFERTGTDRHTFIFKGVESKIEYVRENFVEFLKTLDRMKIAGDVSPSTEAIKEYIKHEITPTPPTGGDTIDFNQFLKSK